MTSEEIWASDSAHISKVMGGTITKRTIRKISFMHDGELLVAELGKPNPYNDVFPVRAIYEEQMRRCYYICDGDSVTIAGKRALVEDA